MSSSVKHYGRYLQSTQQPGECLAVSARLLRCHPCANNVEHDIFLHCHQGQRLMAATVVNISKPTAVSEFY